ncbi:Myc-type, basic helix-loop-helix [Sesbania bispinosa]|nr:Myc-type, basic helix-loop-helix [Sesbania bispinosa]
MVLLRQLEQGMHHVRNYYNSEMLRSSFPRPFISHTYKNSFSKPRSKAEIKLLAAKKHSEAEKRRRMRINGQYDTLRSILPNIIKKDKASVLAETIKQVKELKKIVSKVEENNIGSSKEVKFPSGADKLSLEKCNDDEGLVKAMLSCEDRPGLMSAIAGALGSVKAKAVKAEMVMVGGRTRSVLWVKGHGNEGLGMLKSTLRVAMMHKPAYKMRRFNQQ